MTAWLAGEASALAEGALQLPALLDFPPSLVTAGLVYVARRAAGTYPAWPPCLGALTGASLRSLGTDAMSERGCCFPCEWLHLPMQCGCGCHYGICGVNGLPARSSGCPAY